MTLEQWLLILILVIPLGLVMANKLRLDLAALSMAVIIGFMQLGGLGMLGPAHSPQDSIQAVAGFSQPVVITLISLFIITHSLDKSGVMRWLAHQMIRLGGNKTNRLIALYAAITAFLSLFMNNLAAGALVLPSAMEASRRTGIKPSKLLIPVAYGSLLGGAATYFTTANIIMSNLLRIAHPPQNPLNILDFTPTGGLIAIVGIAFLWLLGDRLLPNREPSNEQSAARRTGSELERLYQVGERLWQAVVTPGSPLVGRTLDETEIGKNLGVTVTYINHNGGDLLYPAPDHIIAPLDRLTLIGREEKVVQLKNQGLEFTPLDTIGRLSPRGIILAEVILAPHSAAEGKTLKEINFRQRFGLTVISLKRLSRYHRTDVGDIPLNLGDSLLVMGKQDQYITIQKNADFILLEASSADQPVDLPRAIAAVVITMGAIGASIAGIPVHLSVLAGAVLALLINLMPVDEAYGAIEWQAVFLIAGMYAVSLALVQTGLAGLVGTSMLTVVKPLGPLGVAGGAYIITAALTQLIGGQVAALVTGPITISAAIGLGVNPQAVAVATAIGCSASFLTPMAHPVNVLMIVPANYKFVDFFRCGWLLTLLSIGALLAGLILFWHL